MFMIPGTGPTSLSVCEFRGTEKDQGNFPSLSAELQALGAGMGVKAKLIFKPHWSFEGYGFLRERLSL